MSDPIAPPALTREEFFQRVSATARDARECWQELWQGWRDASGYRLRVHTVSQDACIVSSFALAQCLSVLAPGVEWDIVFGIYTGVVTREDGSRSYTVRGPHGHAWVEGKFQGTRLFADITGDQFGLQPVQVRWRRPSYFRQLPRHTILPGMGVSDQFHASVWAAAVLAGRSQ